MNPYGEDFRCEVGVLHVRLSGTFPDALLRGAQNLFQPLIDACSTHKCNRVLIDAVNLKADLGTMGLFRAGKDAAFQNRLTLRIAIVTKEDMVDGFFEDVAVDRGGKVRVFTSEDDGRSWLQR